MPSFGPRSIAHLETCHADLQKLAHAAIEHVDFAVIEGHRTPDRQLDMYRAGKSTFDGKLRKSRHQAYPSEAMDVIPWPTVLHGHNVWEDVERFALLVGTIKGIALQLGIPIRLGCDWNGDGSMRDHRLVDYPHIELA